MNKSANLFVFGMVLLLVGFASAAVDTEVSGTIYNGNTFVPITGADVDVTCNGINKIATSDGTGQYSVVYYNNIFCAANGGSGCGEVCSVGDSLFVTATKDGMVGSNTGVVNAVGNSNMDLGIVNVPLVPEFGFVIGMLTMLSSIVVFFVVRKS